jgi:hypothetical protein
MTRIFRIGEVHEADPRPKFNIHSHLAAILTATPVRYGRVPCPFTTPAGPWRAASEIIPGLWVLNTSMSEGFVYVSPVRNLDVPAYMRREGGWYSLVREWCLPFVIFREEISQSEHTTAAELIGEGADLRELQHAFPEISLRHFGHPAPGSDERSADEWDSCDSNGKA